MRNLFSTLALLGAGLWTGAVNAQLVGTPAAPPMTPAGLELIVTYEVGSRAEYWPHPEWPQGASGVTEGIGYDNGYTARELILSDWSSIVGVQRLAATSGITGQRAKAATGSVRDVTVPFDTALDVFQRVDAPRYYALCRRIFPGYDDLAPACQDALRSLVYNRGPGMAGPARVEMREIARLTPKRDYAGIAAQIRRMKRLWIGTTIEGGMLRRREAEARMVESCGR